MATYRGGAVYRREPPPRQAFNPNGPGYDDETADWEGMQAEISPEDGKPHGFSRVPRTGLLLKGREHPTFDKAVEEDRKLGYGLEMRDGRYYTQPFAKHEQGGVVQNFQQGGPVGADPFLRPEFKIFEGVSPVDIARIATGEHPGARHLAPLAQELIDADRQHLKAVGGTGDPWQSMFDAAANPRAQSIAEPDQSFQKGGMVQSGCKHGSSTVVQCTTKHR